MAEKFYVVVLSWEGGLPKKPVQIIPCKSERDAEKVEAGVMINMDHSRYFTNILTGSELEEYYGVRHG